MHEVGDRPVLDLARVVPEHVARGAARAAHDVAQAEQEDEVGVVVDQPAETGLGGGERGGLGRGDLGTPADALVDDDEQEQEREEGRTESVDSSVARSSACGA